MSDHSLMSELTIVIPTFKRPDFLLRQILFWQNKTAKVIILDGNDTEFPFSNIGGIPKNLTYLHLPVPIFERWGKVSPYVKTRYTCFLADDDLFFECGLKACLNELEKNGDLVSCQGRAISFLPNPDGSIWFGKRYSDFESYHLSSLDPLDRLLNHAKNYKPSNVCAVVRSDAWKFAFETYAKREFHAFAVGELQIELLLSYLGKTKVISDLTWLRSEETPSLVGNKNENRSLDYTKTIREWWLSSDSMTERDEFIHLMTNRIASLKRHGVFEIETCLVEALDHYVSGSSKDSALGLKLRGCVKTIMPHSWFRFIKQIKQRFFTGAIICNFDEHDINRLDNWLALQNISFQKKQLRAIQKAIFGNHEGDSF